jgi:hypothetical protein
MADAHMNRLGFDAWADNKLMDAIENTPFIMQGEGNITYEHEDVTIRLDWKPDGYVASIRAHTSEGWKERSTSHKR